MKSNSPNIKNKKHFQGIISNKKADTKLIYVWIGNLLMISVVLFTLLWGSAKIADNNYHTALAKSRDTALVLETIAFAPESLEFKYPMSQILDIKDKTLTITQNTTQSSSVIGADITELQIKRGGNFIWIKKGR